MTLKELQTLINNVNTMGFKPEEIEVNFNYYFSRLNVQGAKSEVKAVEENVQPRVIINLA